jgi:LEA14-like dessication related protein
MRVANITFEQIELVFNLAVENKNPVSIKLAGLDYDLKIEEQSLISGTTAQAIKLKANASSPVQIPITLKFNDLKKLPGELWRKDEISYQLLSQFNIDLPIIGNYAIPVTKQGTLPVPKAPKISVKDIKIKNISFTTAQLVAHVEVNNPNDFNLDISDFNYQLKINQQNWGQGKITQANRIPKNAKTTIAIPVELNLLNAGKSVYNMLINKASIEYQLTGDVTLDTDLALLTKQKFPLDIKGSASFR